MDAWESAAAEYVKLGDHPGSVVQEHEGSRLHCVLRDLSSLSQALGRLRAGLENEPQAAMVVVEHLTKLAAFGARVQMYMPSSRNTTSVLQPDLLAVYVIMAWLFLYNNLIQETLSWIIQQMEWALVNPASGQGKGVVNVIVIFNFSWGRGNTILTINRWE
jgi:hypothetical protein